jgi:hypothetical protein
MRACSRRCESPLAMAVRRRGNGAWWWTIVRYIKFLHARVMSSPPDFSVAASARDSQSGVGQQRGQAQLIAKNMREFAQAIKAHGSGGSKLDCVPACIKNVVDLVNRLSAPFLGSLFQIDYVQAPAHPPQRNMLHYYLQVTCKFYGTGDFESTKIIKPAQEAVVSRLYILISEGATELPNFQKPYPCMTICMDHGATALCVREMHLATVLRICALLLAQQMAYCGGDDDSVCLEGEAVKEATIKIYTDLFWGLHTADYTTSDNSSSDGTKVQVLEAYAQVFNPGVDIPQAIINASNMLSNCCTKSADLCEESFPSQIRKLRREERTHKAAKGDQKTPPASALFLHPHSQTRSLLPVSYVRYCVLNPVYFE